MKKLLLGTALAGSVLLAGSSFAETKVSGYLETTIGTTSSKATGVSGNSTPMDIGYESAIDLTTSSTLKNGLKFEAGISVEDGVQADPFIKLSTGGTTFAVGADVDGVADNVSQEDFTPHIAQSWHDAAIKRFGTLATIAGTNTVHGSNGLYLMHKADTFTVAGVYSPNVASTQAAAAAGTTTRGIPAAVGSGYDLAISGNFGVPGLKVGYGVSEANASQSTGNGDQEGKTYGVQYAIAGFTVGYGNSTNTPVASAIETEIETYGIAYKVSDQLSVGIYSGEVQVDGVVKDESYKSAQIGYDFGGMGITLGYYTVEDMGGVNGADANKMELRTVTKF